MDPRSVANKYFSSYGWLSIPIHGVINGSCTCGRKCLSPGKHPPRKWKNVINEYDPNQLFRLGDPSNIAILTGKPSRLVVIDVDKDKGGYESLLKLEGQYGKLSDHTLTATSGGGGRHLYFSHSGSVVKNGVSILGRGIDLRDDGGYILAPHSTHISGGNYCWRDGLYTPAELPNDLLERLSKPKGQERTDCRIATGERNNSLTSIAGKLRAKGADRDEIERRLHEYNCAACLPPLPQPEVSMIAASVCRYSPNGESQNYKEQWLAEIWSECGPDKPQVRTILNGLSRFMDNDGMNCFPSQELLAITTGYSDRKTIRQNLKHAENQGWIMRYPIRAKLTSENASTGYVASFPSSSLQSLSS